MRNIRIPQVFTLIRFILSSKYVSKEYIKEKSILDFLQNAFNLLGYSDSNQEKQDQNLLCYHYTIAQNLLFCQPHLILTVQRYNFFIIYQYFGAFFSKKYKRKRELSLIPS